MVSIRKFGRWRFIQSLKPKYLIRSDPTHLLAFPSLQVELHFPMVSVGNDRIFCRLRDGEVCTMPRASLVLGS